MPQTAVRRPSRINFTKSNIDALKLPTEGRTYTYDIKTTGLAICLTASGSRTFYLVRKIGGKTERILIGKWPQLTVENARDEADRMNGQIADGLNPNDKRRVSRDAPTLGEVFEEYLPLPTRGKTKRPRSPRTLANYRWLFDKHLAGWRNRQLSKISRSDIEKLHTAIGTEHGTYVANRILSLVKSLFNYAVEAGHHPLNPAARLAGFQELERERVLLEREMAPFWKAVEAEATGDYFKLLLLTGARKQKVLTMAWADLDLVAGTWRIDRDKNGRPLTLPLSRDAVLLLATRQATATTPWVFPSTDGTRPMPTPRHAWERILAAAGISNLRLHDLRRSLGSWQTKQSGAALTVIARSLGHKSLVAAKRYAQPDDDTVRRSVETATSLLLAAAKPIKRRKNA